MNILITRPFIDAEDLMKKIFNFSHKIIHLPTLKILTTNIDPINPNEFDAFIFTSANAIRNLKLNSNNKNLHCFCVGSLTEKIARKPKIEAAIELKIMTVLRFILSER